MEKSSLITVVIFTYLAVTLGVGLVAGRRASRSVQGYVAGDRDFGLLVMYFITGATVFSAFAFLGGPGWAYSRGAAAFYILTYGVLGMAPWYAMGPKVAALGRRFGFVTQAQLLVGRFPSRGLSALMAILTLAAFVPYVTIQMRGAGIVIEAVTDGRIPLAAGAALAYAIVLVYVLSSGVSAVGWTNTFQGVFMLVIAWALGIYLPYRLYGGVGPMFEQILEARPELLSLPGLTGGGEPWSWGAYSTAILASAIGVTMWPHLFMKAYTARSDKIIRRTVILFPTFQLFLIPVFLIGFAGVLFPESPDQADFILPFLILRSDLPALVVGLFCAGALSASMSTGDALLHGAASVVVEDGVQPFRKLSDSGQRLLIRILVVAVGGVAYLFALVEGFSLVDLLLASYGIICQYMPAMVAALYWRRATTAGVVLGLLAGSAVSVFFFLMPELKPLGMHEGILGLIVHIPVLLTVSLRGTPQEDEHVEGYLNV
ncbi:MAG: sodium:solute symporter family protein [Gemmatimonadetes bacterium]|nr:sodium:solute symporter family protein [Gemmatimonadota bacterium]MYB99140.1 sodium:solute symporter family protein [Gemmatimonadota bacterium]MYH54082.1 sodium:solute symporter family protein [Gemmatimonadota bacterium]MYI45308.1 sodium:solute symporter family protein [Gemmatimonadota bacterium]MYK66154.1 sodium:solute symporter family protein [Gemmatimonadota bacterium]